ncbi:MAG: hypothetical protein WCI41_01730 [bacterium]
MKEIRPFKFGGGVLGTPESLPQLLEIIKNYKPEIVVVSAFGKGTNALKDLVEGCISGDRNMTNYAFRTFCEINEPFLDSFPITHNIRLRYANHIRFLENFIKNKPFSNDSLMVKDRILILGEIISSEIVNDYLNLNLDESFSSELVLASSFIKTDMNFGAANVLKKDSLKCFANSSLLSRCLNSTDSKHLITVTQGFIGSGSYVDEYSNYNAPTTLGRESSDYVIALISNMLKTSLSIAEIKEVTLWKNVNGVANIDPNNEEENDHPLVYSSVISFKKFRKQVAHGGSAEGLVHPKTLDELEPLGIPLRIRPFSNIEEMGTLVL